jgi:Amt family ammonium transporter
MMMMSFSAIAVVVVVYVLWGCVDVLRGGDIAGIFANPFDQFGLQGPSTARTANS